MAVSSRNHEIYQLNLIRSRGASTAILEMQLRYLYFFTFELIIIYYSR